MIKRISLLNGLAILAVVLNHSAGWGYTAMFWWTDRYEPTTVPNWDQIGTLPYYVLTITNRLTFFAVPAFLFASGFFIAYAAKGSQTGLTWKFVRTRLVGLLVPYLIWSAVVFAYDALRNVTFTSADYLGRLLFWGAAPPLYYVPVVCALYLLSPLLVCAARSRWKTLLVISGLVQLIIEGLRYLKLLSVPVPGLDTMINLTPGPLFIRWIFFFSLGMVAGFQLAPFQKWLASARWALLAALVVLATAVLLGPEVVFYGTGVDWRWDSMPIIGGVYATAFLLSFLAFPIKVPFERAFHILGSKSYGIYLIHFQSIQVVSQLIYHFLPWILGWQLLYQPVLVFFGLIAVLGFMELVTQSPARPFSRYLFG